MANCLHEKQNVGSARKVTHLAGSPFLMIYTLLVGPSFLHTTLWLVQPGRDNQSMLQVNAPHSNLLLRVINLSLAFYIFFLAFFSDNVTANRYIFAVNRNIDEFNISCLSHAFSQHPAVASAWLCLVCFLSPVFQDVLSAVLGPLPVHPAPSGIKKIKSCDFKLTVKVISFQRNTSKPLMHKLVCRPNWVSLRELMNPARKIGRGKVFPCPILLEGVVAGLY